MKRILENPWYPKLNRYGKPYKPNYQQVRFLLLQQKEAFFGGAAGPGKSEAFLQAAVMYHEVPTYHAIIFRKTIASLDLEGGLIPRSKEWWMMKENENGEVAKWNGQKLRWTFPSGATVGFGYMNKVDDYMRYGSTEYQFIGFDEVTEFREKEYTFLFSRLRATRDLTEIYKVPLRMRCAANPLGPGVPWVKARFNLPEGNPIRPYIAARLEDNAANVDVDAYLDSLSNLDPITRRRLVKGDWTVQDPGRMFRREWFIGENHEALPAIPEGCYGAVRYWDLAATEAVRGKDPDYTCGVLMTRDQQERVYIADVRRFRANPATVEDRILQTAVEDSANPAFKYLETWMEQEPGSAGVNTINHYSRNVLAGYSFQGYKTTGSKALRATPFSTYAANGNVWLIQGPWITPYLDEVESFPDVEHDDQVDASSGAFEKLMRIPKGPPEIGFGYRPI